MIAVSILALGFACLYTTLGQCLNVSRSHLEVLAATECLAQRAEQARAAGWGSILTASAVRDQILSVPLANASALPNLQEQITITPYPAVTPAPTPIIVTRDISGLTSILSQPGISFDLRSIFAVRIDFSLTWQDHRSSRTHNRQQSTVVALGGLLP